LSILPNVSLQISAVWPRDGNGSMVGAFEIVGPKTSLATLLRLVDGDSSQLHGMISPTSPVTIPERLRKAAGIPSSAATYSYIHPIEHLHGEMEKLKLAKDQWAFVLLAGGYAYFDADARLLQINAITFAPSATGLLLVSKPVQACEAAPCHDPAARSRISPHSRTQPSCSPAHHDHPHPFHALARQPIRPSPTSESRARTQRMRSRKPYAFARQS
jgi:hypothetical protein